MSDNTTIFVKYNIERHVFEVAHMAWDTHGDNEEWEAAEIFGTESLALRFAVASYNLLRETGVPPEYGITPLYDANHLIPSEQRKLTEWSGDA